MSTNAITTAAINLVHIDGEYTVDTAAARQPLVVNSEVVYAYNYMWDGYQMILEKALKAAALEIAELRLKLNKS
jgi:phosphoglycerol transferase MdoB-like AlkP superfamily enzyme